MKQWKLLTHLLQILVLKKTLLALPPLAESASICVRFAIGAICIGTCIIGAPGTIIPY